MTMNPVTVTPLDWRYMASKPYITVGDSGYADLDTVLAATPANLTILVADHQTLTDDRTLPATCTLVVLNPGYITIPTTKTLTLTGKFEAGSYMVFDCTDIGTTIYSAVSFGVGSCPEINVIWFGADPSGTLGQNGVWDTVPNDSADAIQNAIYSVYTAYQVGGYSRYAPVRDIRIPRGVYALSHKIRSYFFNRLIGDGRDQTILTTIETFPETPATNGYGVIWLGFPESQGNRGQVDLSEYVKDFTINLTNTTRTKRLTGLWLYQSTTNSLIHNIYIRGAIGALATYGLPNNFIGIHQPLTEYEEDGTPSGDLVSDEAFSTGDGTVGPYTHTLDHITNYGRGTAVITAGAQIIYDNGEGYWAEDATTMIENPGWIDYTTGECSITFPSVVAIDVPITVSYYYNSNKTSSNGSELRNIRTDYLTSFRGAIFIEPNSNAEAQVFCRIRPYVCRVPFNYGGYQSIISNIMTEPTQLQEWGNNRQNTTYTDREIVIDKDAKTITMAAGWDTSETAAGGILVIAGCTTAANDGQYKIVSLTVSNTVVTYSLTTGGTTSETTTPTSIQIFYPGGCNPHIKLTNSDNHIIRDCYWDTDAVIVWLNCTGGYAGQPYDLLHLEGLMAGTNSSESFQYAGGPNNRKFQRPVTYVSDTVISTGTMRPSNDWGIYAGAYIWVEDATRNRYKYYVDSVDNVAFTITVSPTTYLSGGSAPPPLPLDASYILLCPFQRIPTNWIGYNSYLERLSVKELTIGVDTGGGAGINPNYPGNTLTQSLSGTLPSFNPGSLAAPTATGGTFTPGGIYEASCAVTDIQAGSKVTIIPSATTPIPPGIIITSRHTTAGYINFTISNIGTTGASNPWAPGAITTWTYAGVK